MNQRLRELLTHWGLRDWDDGDDAPLDLEAIQYLSGRVFNDYEPAQFDRFEDRLDRWLHNVETEQDKRTLFRLLGRLFFIGRPEFESLCRAAFHGPVLRWLVDELNVDISDPLAEVMLAAEVERTWFCPITDSMRINAFLKVNGLTGKTHRPDWRSLRQFGSEDRIRKYIAESGITRLVLVEDFVGSGTQMKSAVNFAASLDRHLRVLACPLATCPAGDKLGEELAAATENLKYEPAMKILPGMLIKADAQPEERPLHGLVRELTQRVGHRLGPTEKDAESKRHHGYRGTGSVVTLYSNCPNNTLPIVWDETDQWSALFPRLKRA